MDGWGWAITGAAVVGLVWLFADMALKSWRVRRKWNNRPERGPIPAGTLGAPSGELRDAELFTRMFGHEGGDHWGT